MEASSAAKLFVGTGGGAIGYEMFTDSTPSSSSIISFISEKSIYITQYGGNNNRAENSNITEFLDDYKTS